MVNEDFDFKFLEGNLVCVYYVVFYIYLEEFLERVEYF